MKFVAALAAATMLHRVGVLGDDALATIGVIAVAGVTAPVWRSPFAA